VVDDFALDTYDQIVMDTWHDGLRGANERTRPGYIRCVASTRGRMDAS